MNKFNLLIAGWLLVASGWGLLQSSPNETETSAVAPTAEAQNLSVPASIEAPKIATAPARSFTADDVCCIQMRLKEAGFDPAPLTRVLALACERKALLAVIKPAAPRRRR